MPAGRVLDGRCSSSMREAMHAGFPLLGTDRGVQAPVHTAWRGMYALVLPHGRVGSVKSAETLTVPHRVAMGTVSHSAYRSTDLGAELITTQTDVQLLTACVFPEVVTQKCSPARTLCSGASRHSGHTHSNLARWQRGLCSQGIAPSCPSGRQWCQQLERQGHLNMASCWQLA